MNEVKAKVIDEKARKAAQAKIATMLTEFKTQPAEQVVAKIKLLLNQRVYLLVHKV